MLPSVCVATLRGCTARPASRLRWCRPTTGVAVDGVPSPAGANLRSSAPTQRSGRKPGVVEAVAHDRRGASRRRRENSPSRPTIRDDVVDRPTISELFFGRFHAHGFPNKRKCQASTYTFASGPGAPVDRRGRWIFLIRSGGLYSRWWRRTHQARQRSGERATSHWIQDEPAYYPNFAVRRAVPTFLDACQT